MGSLAPDQQIFLAELRDEAPIPPPPNLDLWIKIIVTLSGSFQFICAGIILLAYWRSSEFRQRPGSIVAGFAISSLALSVLWTLNFNSIITDNPDLCPWIGFFAIFFEYNCIFYEIGMLYYFICHYKQVAKPFIMTDFPQRHMNVTEVNTYLDVLRNAFNNEAEAAARQYQRDLAPTRPNLDGPEEQNHEENHEENPEENIVEVDFNEADVDPRVVELKTNHNRVVRKLNATKEELRISKIVLLHMQEEQIDILNYMKDTSYAAMDVQIKIHSCVLVTSLALALIPAIGGELGVDYYGACSKEFAPKEQTAGIIFTILIMGGSALASGIGLTYFLSQKRVRQTIFEANQERRLSIHENLVKTRRILTEEEEHYLKHLRLFVIFSTLFGWLLAATNIYADKMEERGEGGWDDACFIVHFLMIALQGFVLLLLKLTEPMTLGAIRETLRRRPANENGNYRQMVY